jgi:hypothetical protein
MNGDVAHAIANVGALRGHESLLWRPVLELIPISGASISTIAKFLGSETVAASDNVAARIDELQFDLGEGPCWEAMRTAQPVLAPKIRNYPSSAWPAFSDAIADVQVEALFAFPLVFGPLRLGAMDLYSSIPVELSDAETAQGSALADAISRVVLERAIRLSRKSTYADEVTPFSRRLVHQATGMVLAQLDIDAEDAQLLIQAHAYSTGRTVREVAEDILERTLDFSRQLDGIGTSDE